MEVKKMIEEIAFALLKESVLGFALLAIGFWHFKSDQRHDEAMERIADKYSIALDKLTNVIRNHRKA